MKKHYITMAIVIDVLVLALFVIGTGFYTYISATEKMQIYMDRANTVATFNSVVPDSNTTSQELITNSCYTWEFNNDLRLRGMGFYGYIILTDGTVFDTTEDYCYAWKAGEDKIMKPDEVRIFAIPQGFEDPYNIYDPVFEGECDDIFIHGGSMQYQGKTYQIGDYDYNCGEKVSVSEWADGEYLYCVICRLARDDYEKGLNAEAKAILGEFDDSIKSGSAMKSEQQDIWTCYLIHMSTTQAGNMYTVQVFHPVELAVRSNVALYVVLLVLMLAALVAIPLVIAKLYRTRKEYEMRSRRLTRGVAHELKTPLAVTKAYMENWDYIDEKDREEYAKKVGREVEDMSELINAFLEMEKIDSGKIKMNIEEVELVSLIKSVYNHVKPLADDRHLEVELPKDKEFTIKADLKLMRIAIGNYMTNMIKYADKEARITLSMWNDKVRVSFGNDSANDKKSKTDKLNSNGMGVEINENIMKLHGFRCGNDLRGGETIFWFEATKA